MGRGHSGSGRNRPQQGRLQRGISKPVAADALRAWALRVQQLVQAGAWAAAKDAAAALDPRIAPQGVGVLLALGNALYDAGRHADAVAVYAQAERIGLSDPAQALEAAYNRACCLRDFGDLAQALAAFRLAQAVNPGLVQVYDELLSLGQRLGVPDGVDMALCCALAFTPARPALLRIAAGREAATATIWKHRALRLEPEACDLLAALAVAYRGQGEAGQAAACIRRALAVAPADIGLLNNATLLMASPVIAARACRLCPDHTESWLNRGVVAQGQRDAAMAEACYRRAAVLEPARLAAWGNLGGLAVNQGRYETALHALERGFVIGGTADDLAGLYANQGVAWMSTGQNGAAVQAFRHALAGRPDDAAIRSNLLFCLCFDPASAPEAVYQEHRAFEQRLAVVNRPLSPRPALADGRLRVGYVSPDFQRYPGPGFHFLLPLLRHHDRARFAVTAYYTDSRHDDTTAAFQQAAEHWRDAATWSDRALAEQVAADGIDILVDCDGHMSRNRMTAFAGRMAPLQVSFPLYPNTTGLSAMDYQFGDRWLTPETMQPFRREALVRLPGCVLCYHPADSTYAPPAAAPWERAGAGRFTFASFNNLAKLDPETLAVWSRILREAPDSRLMLKWRGLVDGVARRVCDAFAAHGVAAERLVLCGPTPDPYEGYGAVDLCLDPVFAAGGTTTCDALWTGTPTLTLPGVTAIGRWGLSLLNTVGLADFVAISVEDYIARAVAFAGTPQTLSAARQGLRDRVASSPLMDAVAYTRGIEAAYTAVWQRHRDGLPPAPVDVVVAA